AGAAPVGLGRIAVGGLPRPTGARLSLATGADAGGAGAELSAATGAADTMVPSPCGAIAPPTLPVSMAVSVSALSPTPAVATAWAPPSTIRNELPDAFGGAQVISTDPAVTLAVGPLMSMIGRLTEPMAITPPAMESCAMRVSAVADAAVSPTVVLLWASTDPRVPVGDSTCCVLAVASVPLSRAVAVMDPGSPPKLASGGPAG